MCDMFDVQTVPAPDQRTEQRQPQGSGLEAYLAQAQRNVPGQPPGARNQVLPPALANPNLQTTRGQPQHGVPRQPQGMGKQVSLAQAQCDVQRPPQDVRMQAFPHAQAFPNPAAHQAPGVMQHPFAGQGAAPHLAMPCLPV
jgi:hypothetical protein